MGSSRGGAATVARSGGRWRGRALRLLLAVASIQLTMVAQPAWACGCGAAVPAAGRTLTVGQETSVVRWDGGVEEIDMRLTVSGDAEQAAWIMPVPSRATLTLGDDALFSTLETVVAPVDRVRRHFWPRDGDWPFSGGSSDGGSRNATAPAPGSGVAVVGRERLGPFDVARLAATDSKALGEWLTTNGFHLPDALATALDPYVRQNWEYVAIRLAPDESGRPLGGNLDPLHLSFASDRLVYPMRLSRLAKVPQHLRLYVVAAHRMQPRSNIGGAAPKVLYAGTPREPASAVPQLQPIAGKPAFLTAIDQEFPTPSTIADDHELRPAGHDTTYQQARYHDELLKVGGIPAWLATVVGVVAVLVGAGLLVARRRRSA
ncbi:DUF2330 domain-containing protein, partial [Streptomyces sp. SID3343]|uniref:DUF2330 domain-containing protein n=1 Tax=Streptomyces sp. SID3343 TaxID=2690260 RepID=UPI00136B5002